MIKSKEKEKYFSQKRIDIKGSSGDEKTHIYQLCDSGLMVREAHLKSKKGGEAIEILQFTDPHLNKMNERDYMENDAVVASTRQYRMAFRNESTVSNVKKTMEIASFFDKIVVTGDIIDYLTWGSLELARQLIWEKAPDALMPIGGHDFVRAMEAELRENTPVEERMEILKSVWKHDLYYTSEILADKVMTVALYNNGKYFGFQAEKLKADIEKARKEDLIIIIFQHENICTRNPMEEDVKPIRQNDRSDIGNYRDKFLGSDKSDEETMAVYRLITENADVIKGVFCGHAHNDYYTEIIASYEENGKRVETVIPQYVLTGNMYDEGHVMIITVE